MVSVTDSTDTIINIIGYIAGGFVIISLIPQLIKIIKSKSSDDISILTLVIILTAQILWSVFGFYKNDLQIIVTNVTAGCISVFIIFITLLYKHIN
jgi:MtN3 and saliva related transmembrane protein